MTRSLLAVGLARRALTIVLWAMVAVVVAVGGAARLAPLTGHELLAIRSGSMAPALPVGAMAAVVTSGAVDPQPGDAVAFRLPSGHLVVHRLVEITADGTGLITRGDANATVDPWPVPRDRLVGAVAWQLPAAGYLLGMLGMLSGVLALVAMAGALLTTIWLLEDLESELATLPEGLSTGRPRVTATWSKADGRREAGLGHPARRLR